MVGLLLMATGSVAKLTPDGFRNVLVHVEAILNHRPIALDGEGRAICPAHLLNPAAAENGGFPVTASPAKTLRKIRQAVKIFWDRWRRFYLSSISLERLAGGRLLPVQLEAGDSVVVFDATKNFSQVWRVGKVVEAIQSTDGFVRSVKVLVDGEIKYHDIRNLGVLDPALRQRLTSTVAPNLRSMGGVSAIAAPPVERQDLPARMTDLKPGRQKESQQQGAGVELPAKLGGERGELPCSTARRRPKGKAKAKFEDNVGEKNK
jgi:hypothetical protein